MTTPARNRPPRAQFTGVDTFTDVHQRYQFRFPTDWAKYELDGYPEGVMFSPYPNLESPKTFISAYAIPLEFEVVAEDMDDLTEAVNEGLHQFDAVNIEHQANDAFGNLLKFDRTFTFREGDDTRKRHTWILYVGKWQIVFAYQGETVEDFDFWLPMGNTMFFHIKIPDSFWFATDRDLNKFKDNIAQKVVDTQPTE
jgi:hypothetical protein